MYVRTYTVCIHVRDLCEVKFWGEPTHLFIRVYVCTHTHAAQACVFNDINNHTDGCSMHIRFSFRIMMKTRQWLSIVMY